jgi:hypothetical protein
MTSLKQFIKDNRTELDQCIHSVCPGISLNDEDRKEWINNDEGLYRWARSEGCRI